MINYYEILEVSEKGLKWPVMIVESKLNVCLRQK